MKNIAPTEDGTALSKLSGEIVNYKCTRASASFVYSEQDCQKLGIVAIAAALAGMGGQATAAAASASAVEEEADYVEFSVNGAVVKGWVWRSPFKKGDIVDVAAQWQTDHWEAFGIVRPEDQMIALYPHCSRARKRHIKNAIKWWAIWNILFFGFLAAFFLYLGGIELLLQRELYHVLVPTAIFLLSCLQA